jgi:O-antigen/teichoic acid export membrane protein
MAARRALYVLVPVAVIISLAAPLGINILIGDAYAESVVILRILIWGVVLSALVGPNYQALWALGQQRRLAVLAVGSACATLVLTVALLMTVGVAGAAVADLGGKLLLLGGSALLLRRFLEAEKGVRSLDMAAPSGRGEGRPSV